MSTRQELQEKLGERCDSADLMCTLLGEGPFIARIEIPQGRDTRRVVVREENAAALLSEPFEDYVFLGDYQGICSYARGEIEVLLEVAGSGAPAGGILRRRVRDRDKNAEQGLDSSEDLFSLAGPQGVTLSVGQPSELMRVMMPGDRATRPKVGASLRIQGLSVGRQDAALASLETLGNGLLFQLDAKLDLAVLLRRRPDPRFRVPRHLSPREVSFPSSEFDPEPMSLFWYGRGAQGLPLLEFFAYYQVLEFYFGQFAEQEARRRVKSVLKNPGFSPHHDRDIGKVVRVATRAAGKSSRDERSQLRATIQGCADAEDLRAYITSDDDRRKFFETKDADLTDMTIRPVVSDSDLLGQIAERIYDIRCRIVHTKDDGGGEEVGLLLPFSPAARKLNRDIRLLEQIARQALIHASRPLGIEG